MLRSVLEWWQARRRRDHLCELVGHLRHQRHVQDDLLGPAARAKLDELVAEGAAVAADDAAACREYLERAPQRAVRLLPQPGLPVLREYLDIIAVALTVAFGIRGLYLQPFKIPTSSMQPTLFGIHYVAEEGPDGYRPYPRLPAPLYFPLFAAERADLTTGRAGELDEAGIRTFRTKLIFPWSRFAIGGEEHALPGTFAPGDPANIDKYALHGRRHFAAGEEVCRGWLSRGDHLFVDRVSHLFREPRRGDIVVFATVDIVHRHPLLPYPRPLVDQGYYYIKRLVGLPGDTLRIADGKLLVRPAGADHEVPVTELDQRFAKLYSGQGGYHGHQNGDFRMRASFLIDPQSTFTVPPDSYFVMGDNTSSSADSRYWGTVPRRNYVGRACFVFWPFSRRWGVPDRQPPLPFSSYGKEAPMSLQ